MCNTVNGTEWRHLPSEDKMGRFGMPILGYNSYRKQMEICHGPFKRISTLRIEEQYQSLVLYGVLVQQQSV